MIELMKNLSLNLRADVKTEITPIVERLNLLETKVNTQEIVITELKDKLQAESTKNEQERRRRNILLYNVEENATENSELLENLVLLFLKEKLKIECKTESIDYVSRIGKLGSSNRPIMVRFLTLNKKLEVLRNRKFLINTNYGMSEDFSKEIREKRKELIPEMTKLRSEGKRVILKMDKLVVLGDFQNGHEQRGSSRGSSASQQSSGGGGTSMDCDDVVLQDRKRMKPFTMQPPRISVLNTTDTTPLISSPSVRNTGLVTVSPSNPPGVDESQPPQTHT